MGNYLKKLKFQNKITVFNTSPNFGRGPAEIMKHVQETNSLSKAYNKMNLSPSKGWKIIKKAEEDLGFPLFETAIGGKDGGHSKLSPEGEEFLRRYNAFVDELNKESQEIFKKHFAN